MAKLHHLEFEQWNDMVRTFHDETDRGAAVLAGGFVEHFLGRFIQSYVKEERLRNDLFGPLGPLSSFSQRIAVAYAFGFITKEHYDDLRLIKDIRNHFAHHPLGTSFETSDVAASARRLSDFETVKGNFKEPLVYRVAYLITCGTLCGQMWMKMESDGGRWPPRSWPPEIKTGGRRRKNFG
jgi:hypothetical protein